MQASVIIPTYNNAKLLELSLESWVKQSVPQSDFEVIIVDNNSSDNTFEIAGKFVQRHNNFKYIKELKAGATYARHAGAKIAKSEYFIFADDDGIFNSSCIEEIFKVYKLNSEVDAVAGKIEILWDKAPPEWISQYEFMLGKLSYGDDVVLAKDLYLNGGLFSIKRNVFYKLKGFNPDLIGSYLVGDGDTGLVLKLHENNSLIGWTAFAIMQHMQFVDVNATEKDIGRRFFNTGISKIYGVFRLNTFKMNYALYKLLFKTFLLSLKKYSEYYILRKRHRKYYFSLMQRKGELAFFRHWISREFRETCKDNSI